MTIILLENDDLTRNTNIGGNVDPDRYWSCVKTTQELWLEPILGETLYQKIQDDFDAPNLSGTTTGQLTGIYLTLFEKYIRSVVINKTAEIYLAEGAYMVSNAGITKTSTENTETVSKAEVDYLVVNKRKIAESYIKRLEKFLKANAADIPEYDPKPCGMDGEHPETAFGMYIPTVYNRRDY